MSDAVIEARGPGRHLGDPPALVDLDLWIERGQIPGLWLSEWSTITGELVGLRRSRG